MLLLSYVNEITALKYHSILLKCKAIKKTEKYQKMSGIYRISECKNEYVDHHPYPDQYPRPYLPKLEDNLKVFLCHTSTRIN